MASNLCSSLLADVVFENVGISDGQVGVCAATNSVQVENTVNIFSGGKARDMSPNTVLMPGFVVPSGGDRVVAYRVDWAE